MFKTGDLVRIIPNENNFIHMFNVGDVCTVMSASYVNSDCLTLSLGEDTQIVYVCCVEPCHKSKRGNLF